MNNQNANSISELHTPFKKINQKMNFRTKKIELKNKTSKESPKNVTNKENSPEKYSLSTLIHNVSNYKKEIGEDFKIDVDNIKPRNLKNINRTTKALYYPKFTYDDDKFQNPLKPIKKNKYTINLHKETNNLNISNFINENNNFENFTQNIVIKDEPKDFYSLFPIEKLSKFETKFIILITKIKNSKYMKEEYLKWMEDFQTSPFYEFSLNNQIIKSNDLITLTIKSSINLIVLSMITGFWAESNNDIINDNETLNEFSSELIINNHQLYLLICLYILLKGKFMLWSQVNNKIVRFLEQIKTYLNNIISDFNDKDLAIKEIKNANSRVVRSIHKILNFENLFSPDINYFLRIISTIDIFQLYELFRKIQKNDFYISNYNKMLNRTADDYYNSYQFENNNDYIETENYDNSMINDNNKYFNKIDNYNNNKNKNKIINIIINNNNYGDISNNNKRNSVIKTETKERKKYITVNLRNYGKENSLYVNKTSKYKESIKDLNKNKSYINTENNHIINNDIIQKNNNFTDKNSTVSKKKSITYQTADLENKYYNTSKNKFLSQFRTTEKKEPIPSLINIDTKNYFNIINNYESTPPTYEHYNTSENINNNNNFIKNNYIHKKFFKPSYPYLPKENSKKFTLVLDLDETLVQFRIDNKKLNKEKKVILRPGLFEFLNKAYSMFELVVWTVATKEYADSIIDLIEEKKKYFSYRLYREYATDKKVCFLKDLTKLGRDLSKVIIVDDKAVSFSLQKENGILIKPFLGSNLECKYDVVLYDLIKILTKIILVKSQDVREGIQKYKSEIYQKISKINNNIDFYDNRNEVNSYVNEKVKTERDEKNENVNKKYQKIKIIRNKEDWLKNYKYNSAGNKKQ